MEVMSFGTFCYFFMLNMIAVAYLVLVHVTRPRGASLDLVVLVAVLIAMPLVLMVPPPLSSVLAIAQFLMAWSFIRLWRRLGSGREARKRQGRLSA